MRSLVFLGIAIAAVGTVACVAQTTSTDDSNQTPATLRPSTQIAVESTGATRTYTNFSRVTGTPEEVILDFGLNAQPFGTPKDPIVIDQRVIMNFYTAKRLAAALQLTIDRHEKAFGPIETDVQKRVKGNP